MEDIKQEETVAFNTGSIATCADRLGVSPGQFMCDAVRREAGLPPWTMPQEVRNEGDAISVRLGDGPDIEAIHAKAAERGMTVPGYVGYAVERAVERFYAEHQPLPRIDLDVMARWESCAAGLGMSMREFAEHAQELWDDSGQEQPARFETMDERFQRVLEHALRHHGEGDEELSVELGRELKGRVEACAQKLGISVEEVVNRAVNAHFQERRGVHKQQADESVAEVLSSAVARAVERVEAGGALGPAS